METTSTKTILIVDDETALCHMLSEMLAEEGYRLLEASSGTLALDILKSTDVDLIISDIEMPGMTGFDLLKQVNELYPKIKIQLVSGYSDQVENGNVLHKKILYKPYSQFDMIERVRDMLGSVKS
jgi:CheY-like chemotaxis protein